MARKLSKGSGFVQTLKLSPQVCPSNQTLTKSLQKLCCFFTQALTKDPQTDWQTLKKFDYTPKNSVKTLAVLTLLIYSYITILATSSTMSPIASFDMSLNNNVYNISSYKDLVIFVESNFFSCIFATFSRALSI